MLLEEYLRVDTNYESVEAGGSVSQNRKEMNLGGKPSIAPGMLVALWSVLVVWCGRRKTIPRHTFFQELRVPNYLSRPHFIEVHRIFPMELQICEGRIMYFMPLFLSHSFHYFYISHRCSANTCRIMSRSNE